MTDKYKSIFSDACTLKITYMFPNNRVNEHKTKIYQANGHSMSKLN